VTLTAEELAETAVTSRRRAWRELALGCVILAFGIGWLAFDRSDNWPLGLSVVGIGTAVSVLGLRRLLTYRMFVSWRYLLNNPPKVQPVIALVLILLVAVRGAMWFFLGVDLKTNDLANPLHWIAIVLALGFIGTVIYVLRHSKPSLYTFFAAAALSILAAVLVNILVVPAKTPFDDAGGPETLIKALVITNIGAAVVAGLAMFFGSLRSIFTFFTTVPIGGVWIGTAALVVVLSVMSGFETDLREKILGSNAHIQIAREDGDFTDWREVKARIDKIPGIRASTPYASSEVVIASNNNGMPVIIKGIDMATVGKVTDLISDLEDRDAVERMEPLVKDPHARDVPQTPVKNGGNVVDPPPDDMPTGGEPIDFSPTTPDAGEPTDSTARPDDETLGANDPPPDDMLTTDEPPIDYSEPDAVTDDGTVRVIDVPLEPSLSRRTQALPGILVGRELVKQTHLYTGEEVRVVSPLSDPSNPDATGTPIPFNRDYRVAGIFYTGMYEYDLKYVYVTLESLQDFLDRGDSVDGIEVRISDPDDSHLFVGPNGRIREALGPGYRIQDWRELNRSLFSALKLEKIAMFIVLGIVILVASFSIVGNLIMVVVEKGREIALLKTLGASDVGVMQLFAIQGLFIGVIGTILGVVTGLLTCWAGKKFGLPLNPDVYYIDRLPIHIDPQSVLAAAAAGVIISIAATFYPAMLAARVRPAAGMRH
jgi:lipoprotein-releasing system permease protein